jgi:LysR family transcriptional regulator, low CO2-responsive transcriptional regulator
MRHVTVRQLQIFVAAAKSLSFARVADQLHLTPAAVSFQIKQIESSSGFPLFERIGKKVHLTEAGRSLLGYAEVIMNALNDADQLMLSLKGGEAGRVTVGLVSTAKYIVPHILARFRSLYPAVSIRLVDGNRREILSFLANGDVDLAITGRPPEDLDIEARAFARHPTVLIAAPSHPLTERSRIRVIALAGEAFVFREDGSGTRSLVSAFFERTAIKPRVAMTSSSNETIKQAVMAGMGIAALSRHTIGLELALGLLKILPVQGWPLMRTWFVAHRRRMPLLPLHVRMRDFFVAEGPRIIAELERSYANAASRSSSR